VLEGEISAYRRTGGIFFFFGGGVLECCFRTDSFAAIFHLT
jgi:hypothetical protein